MLGEIARQALQTLLPKGQVFTDKATLIAYEADAGVDKGLPDGVAFPRSAKEVARIVRWASEYNVALIARGAGTGLSGGAVADRGGIIVEFSHMHSITNFDVGGRSATMEPALINLRLDEMARQHGLYFPPDPSSQRASTIGGNVAENSGGPHCFKYGVTTNYITGLQVVLANGETVQLGGRALDYPEYDLCGLITGSEGMLALITSISVRLLRNPPAVKTMLAIFDDVEQAGNAVSAVITAGLVPATMEMMDQQITAIIEPFAHAGLPLDAGAILIIEVDGYSKSLDRQMSEIATLLEQHGGHDLRISSNEEERARIWLARKSAAGAVARLTPSYYTVDITVPRSRLAEMLSEVNEICRRHDIRTGHLLHAGDGNLHPMLLIPNPEDPELMRRIHQAGWEMVRCCLEKEGSLTGEHGVGIEKREYMALMHNQAELEAMWDVKMAFDPHNIFNPGKVFPPSKTGSFERVIVEDEDSSSTDAPLPLTTTHFAPASTEEAARLLAALSRAERPAYIDTPPFNPDEQAVTISTSNLRGIKKYAPDDLYITVGAGTPLEEVQEFLAREQKFVPLASPWPTTTIGEMIASNMNAPLRMRYGAIRDLVLYLTVALADGRIIRTGRPIVKNVAGYDLTKAFIGAHNTLGLVTNITLKLLAAPRSRQTILVPVDDLQEGLRCAQELLPLALTASALLLCKGSQLVPYNSSPYLLVYTAEGFPQDVETEIDQVCATLERIGAPTPTTTNSTSGTALWSSIIGSSASQTLQTRIGIAASDLPAYLLQQRQRIGQSSFVADISNGFIYVNHAGEALEETQNWLQALQAAALAINGYAIPINRPDYLHAERALWSYPSQGLSIMQALKERWDPHGILNPGLLL